MSLAFAGSTEKTPASERRRPARSSSSSNSNISSNGIESSISSSNNSGSENCRHVRTLSGSGKKQRKRS